MQAHEGQTLEHVKARRWKREERAERTRGENAQGARSERAKNLRRPGLASGRTAVRDVGRHLAQVPGLQPAVDAARAEVERRDSAASAARMGQVFFISVFGEFETDYFYDKKEFTTPVAIFREYVK